MIKLEEFENYIKTHHPPQKEGDKIYYRETNYNHTPITVGIGCVSKLDGEFVYFLDEWGCTKLSRRDRVAVI